VYNNVVVTIERLITTAEQLAGATGLGRCELLRGELIMMTPAGAEHGRIAASVAAVLTVHVKQNHLGVVMGAETGFLIRRDPDTVRAPDVAFVRAQRYPSGRVEGFFEGPPDLAVEILSPSDRASHVLAKVQDWLAAGCGWVWVVDPETATIALYRSRSEFQLLTAAESLDGGDLLPGFSVPVASLFSR
jgi:Uma2 family endonuclease